MNRISFTGIALLFSFTACSNTPPGDDGSSGSGGKATGAGGTTGGSGGQGTGGTGGSSGGAGGSAGTAAPATGGVGGAGATAGQGSGATGGAAGTGTGVGGAGGSPVGGAAGTGGGVSTGGMGVGGGTAGTGGDAGGTAGAGATGSGGMGVGGSGDTGAVTVQLSDVHQKIEGFGINDNWGSQFSSTVADQLFTTTGTGIGLTILRTGMSDSGAFYNSFEATQISNFKSRAGTDAKVIGSVWSPPASCKSNNNVNDGGHLNTGTCYDSWSTTIANFAGTNGFYAMSIGNEPEFASCGSSDPCNGNYPTTLYTANEMVNFVKVAGPKLKAKNVLVIAPEVSEWDHLWSNGSAGPDVGGKNSSDPLKCGFPAATTGACTTGGGYDYGHYLAADATAWGAFDIIGVHEYDSQHAFPWPSDVTAAKKEIWQTEMSGVKWWPEQGPSSDAANAVAVAGWIHDALVTGDASAWLWWWWQASGTDDNEGLLLKSGTDTRRHYALGNYSKFVRPGYNRVGITGAVPTGVLLSAYKGGDGTVVVVAINKGSADASVPITIAGTAPTMMTPWVTSMADNLVSKTAVAVTAGAFTASLASQTVTTFVGK